MHEIYRPPKYDWAGRLTVSVAAAAIIGRPRETTSAAPEAETPPPTSVRVADLLGDFSEQTGSYFS